MILRDATIKYKGYDPDDLTLGSHKRICVVCDHCGRVRYVSKREYRDLCQKCTNKKLHSDPIYIEKYKTGRQKLKNNPEYNKIVGRLDLPEKEICEKYISGMSIKEIGYEYGCSTTPIINRLHDNNIKIRSNSESHIGLHAGENNPRYINLPEKEICDKYIHGMNSTQLYKEYKCDRTTILRLLRKNGVEIRLQKIDLPEDKICIEYLSGVSTEKLGDYYKCGAEVIRRRLRENGIDIRNNVDAAIQAHEIDPTYDKRVSDGVKQAFIDDPTYGKRVSDGIKQAHKRDPTIVERHSAKVQGQSYPDKWTGFIGDERPHLIPETRCIKLNDRFPNSHAHHITPSVIIYIPAELHKHISHNLKTGRNMGEINMLALQFINGGL